MITYREIIDKSTKAINAVWKKDTIDEGRVVELLEALYEASFGRLHKELSQEYGEAVETERRAICAVVIKDVLPKIERIMEIEYGRNKQGTMLNRVISLYEKFYAIAAFRSLKHFALYTDFDRLPRDKVWTDTLNVFEGFWYYAGKMILDGKVNFLEKQLPTGYGKSFSDVVLIGFIFGVDKNTDILKVFGSKANIKPCGDAIESLMTSKRYADVFPEYQKYGGKKGEMFEYCRSTSASYEFKVEGATKSRSLFVISKDSKPNGVRARYLFCDDITQAEDKANITQHEKDIRAFLMDWMKRNYSKVDFRIICGGTTYHYADFLSFVKERFGSENAEVAKINKYTKIAKCDYMRDDGISVFVCVPKLDYETDTSTYERKYPTKQERKMRDNGTEQEYEDFMAMEQQQPLPPSGNPFYWDNLHTYEILPTKQSMGGTRTDTTYMAIDLPRSGANNLSVGVFSQNEEVDRLGNPITMHYLVDGIYRKTPMDKPNEEGKLPVDEIVDMVIKHNCVELVAENNVETTIATQILTKLAEKGYTSCRVNGIYSWEHKQDKIYNESYSIQSCICVPRLGLYSEKSDMGRMLRCLVNWNVKAIEDDAPDMFAMYSAHFIRKRKQENPYILIQM